MTLDVTKYDTEALATEAAELLQKKDSWKDAYKSSTGTTVIELVSAIVDRLHYSLERRSQENYLPTARLKTSVYALASGLGYRPRRRVSASGVLRLTLFDANGQVAPLDTVVIPKYTEIDFNGVTLVVVDEHVLTSTTPFPYEFRVVEGRVRTAVYDSSDVSSTLFKKNYINLTNFESIEEDSLVITTPTQTFSDVSKPVGDEPPLDSLSFADSETDAYDIRFAADGLRILFGDGVNGRRPTGQVTIKWIESQGKAVSILSLGSAFKFPSDKLLDTATVIPPVQYTYTLTNVSQIIGGKDAEDVDGVRQMAPDYVRTAGNAVTKHDYAFWALRSGIGDIVATEAYGEQELGTLFTNMNNVYVTYLTSSGGQLSLLDQQRLRDYLDVYKNVTVHTILRPADIVEAQLNVRVRRVSGLTASNSEVYQRVKETLQNLFVYEKNSIGKPFYHSDIVDKLVNMKTVMNGSERRVLEYVNVDMRGLYKVGVPYETYEATINVLGTGTHNVTVAFNGASTTATSSAGTATAAASQLFATLDAIPSLTVTMPTTTSIKIVSDVLAMPFTITNAGSSNKSNTKIEIDVLVPVPDIVNKQNLDQLVPGSIQIVTANGTVHATDNGAGVIWGGTVNYKTGAVKVPMQTEETFYIRFKQNEDLNLLSSARGVIGFYPPKANYLDVTDTLTTIEII